MHVIRDGSEFSPYMMALLIDWGIRRCNEAECTNVPNTIVSVVGDDVPILGLCEEHYQQGNVPGGTKYNLVFNRFSAFKYQAMKKDKTCAN